MAYTPTEWKTGDIITAEKLNNIEGGIVANDAALTDVKEDLSGWSDDTKQALLQLAAKVAYIDGDGQDYYDALEAALYPDEPPATLLSISAVYTQSGTVYSTDTLDTLKSDLVVTAHYSDGTTATIANGYTLSGTLTGGTSTITVTYQDKTATFSVNVTAILYPLLDGVYSTSNGEYKFTISKGHHIKCEVVRSGTTSTHFTMLNCYTGDYSVSNSNAINNLSALFTVLSGKTATIKLKNVVNNSNGDDTKLFEFIVIMRKANSNTSFLATSQTTHTTDVTVNATAETDEGISAVGFGVNGMGYKQGAYVEFDLEITVGDDIYVGGTGSVLKVATYNVGQWYIGTGTNVPSAKDAEFYALQNGMISNIDADVLMLEEYWKVFSGTGRTAKSMLEQYYPYIHEQGGDSGYYGRCICSRFPISDYTLHTYTNDSSRYYDSCIISVNGTDITLVITHLDTDGTKRAAQFTELLAFLETLDTFICCGDFNTLQCRSTSGADYSVIIAPLLSAGFNVANCSDFGFLDTYFDETSQNPNVQGGWAGCLDNIVTSSDIDILNVGVDTTKLTDSITDKTDHMPLYATVELS